MHSAQDGICLNVQNKFGLPVAEVTECYNPQQNYTTALTFINAE